MTNKIVPIDNTFYVTRNGQKAERDALASGRKIKIASVVVDSTLLVASSSPEYMNAVQDNPTDSDGKKAIYPVGGQSVNDQLLVAWTLPANSGGYHINGLGFILEDGTLWGYQRVQLGYKAPAGDGALFEPKGLITHETSAATSITFNLSLDDIYATIDDVRYLVNENKKDMWRLMRKMEGKVGRVRLYMANDVDDDYLTIRGQTITNADYPDYFKHLGITASSIKLPDWSTSGYIRQFSDSLAAGATLAQQILRHNHSAATGAAGGIAASGRTQTITIPIKGQTVEGTISKNGGHRHKFTEQDDGGMSEFDTLHIRNVGHNYGRDGSGGRAGYWTSLEGEHHHSHNLTTPRYDVNVSIDHSTPAVASHVHPVTINYNGHDENRPNTTIAVYAVKVKYITPAI